MNDDIVEMKEMVKLIQKNVTKYMDTLATTLMEVRDRVVHIEKYLKTNLPKLPYKVETCKNDDVDKSFQSDSSSASKSLVCSSVSSDSASRNTAPLKYKNTPGCWMYEVII